MTCVKGIAANIISDCNTSGVGGNEVKAWIGNRTEMTFTYDGTNPSKITAIAVASTKQLFTFVGVKKLINSGHDLVVAEDRPNKYTHYINIQGFDYAVSTVENLDNLDDVVVIVESKDKTTTGEGVFRVYGAKYGLYPTTDTARANDLNGARNIELASQSGEEEPHSNYTFIDTDYATTLQALVNLESVQP